MSSSTFHVGIAITVRGNQMRQRCTASKASPLVILS